MFILTETFFNSDSPQHIGGYVGFHSCRDSGRGGGVSVFTKEGLNSQQVNHLSIVSPTIEICTVKIDLNGTPLVIFGVYRPHSDSILNFCYILNDLLVDAVVAGKPAFVVGDLNIDLLLENPHVQSFTQLMHSFHYLPLILKPTRFPNDVTRPSLLDQI